MDESSGTQISRIFKFYPKHHQELQVPKMEVLNLILLAKLVSGFPIRRIPTAYIGEI